MILQAGGQSCINYQLLNNVIIKTICIVSPCHSTKLVIINIKSKSIYKIKLSDGCANQKVQRMRRSRSFMASPFKKVQRLCRSKGSMAKPLKKFHGCAVQEVQKVCKGSSVKSKTKPWNYRTPLCGVYAECLA